MNPVTHHANAKERASPIRRCESGESMRWEGVDVLRYKEEGAALFRSVTRQTLFRRDDLAGELRYFEVAPAGHTTLERHEHAHAVMVLRGKGCCLVGDRVYAIAALDLVTIPPHTWHQFRARADGALGFLCMVDASRDRPELPDAKTIEAIRTDSQVADFLDGEL